MSQPAETSGHLEIEVIGAQSTAPLLAAARAALGAVGVADGHLAIELVDPAKMQALNQLHREIDKPTDVLSFPIDGTDELEIGTRELGDVVICPEHTTDLAETVVHGVLHLCGYDHETDDGEMLGLQDQVIEQLRQPQ